MLHEYTIDRVKYGLPAGDQDPHYTAVKWPLSKCMAHCRAAVKAFGPHVADLFGVSASGGHESLSDRLTHVVAGGYLDSLVTAVGDYDFVESFKRMAVDGKLRRTSPTGVCAVYDDSTDLGRSSATAHAEGLELYYAGQPDVLIALWWAMLCENSRPFGSLHGWIAEALQRTRRASSPTP